MYLSSRCQDYYVTSVLLWYCIAKHTKKKKSQVYDIAHSLGFKAGNIRQRYQNHVLAV